MGTFSVSKLFGEFGVERSEQTCPGREICLPGEVGRFKVPWVSRGDFGKYQTFRAGILRWLFLQGWWFIGHVWQKWVSSTSAPLSGMQVEAPPPDASHISGPGLEGDKTHLQCLQSWTCPLSWALSALPIYPLQCLLWTQPPQPLLLTVPQVPVNFCTFSLLMFKVSALHWTAETQCGRNRIQNSQQLCPELNLTFQAAQTKTFPPTSALPLSVLWLTATGRLS